VKPIKALETGNSPIDCPVYNRYALEIHQELEGPAIIEEMESTTVIGPNSKIAVDAYKNIIIDLEAI